jgi:SNF2 family DNA or RNA helicase
MTMQIIENKALLIETAEPKLITDSIKKSAVVSTNGSKYKVLVRWGLEEAQSLTLLKHKDIPSPILRDYKWTGKLSPFEHQKTTASFLSLHDRAFCFNEQGTGKTASVIWAADYLLKRNKIKRVLVLCPLSIMKSAWQQDLFKFAMHRSCGVAHGDAKSRKKIVAAGAEFVIVNFDGLAIIKDEIIDGGFDLIVVDEANAYKNAQTNRWKVLNEIMKETDARLWMLTGTPAAQSPLDAYGLARLVNPENSPKYYSHFRAETMYPLTKFKWVPKPGSDAYVHTMLQPAIRFEKKDCLDLPDVTYLDRDAPLTAQQAKYYKQLKTEMLLEAAGEEVSAVNAAVKINKLLQISGGAVYSDTGEVIEFDVSTRLNAVLEVIEEASNKVLVFVPFTHTIELLRAKLEKEGISCAVINGKVPVNRRTDIVAEFQTKKTPHVLLIQPQAASHGLTLTAADTIIWYAPVTSVETYLQANARINRPGQKNAMTIVHIRGSEVEDRLYSMLRGNISNHERIIDLYRGILGTP